MPQREIDRRTGVNRKTLALCAAGKLSRGGYQLCGRCRPNSPTPRPPAFDKGLAASRCRRSRRFQPARRIAPGSRLNVGTGVVEGCRPRTTRARSSSASWIAWWPRSHHVGRSISLPTISRRTRPRWSPPGSTRIRASRCTTRPPTAPGRIKGSSGSRRSNAMSSRAASLRRRPICGGH